MCNGHMQVGRLAKNGVCRRLMRVQESMHAQIGVLFVRSKRQTNLSVQRRFVAIKRNRSRTHGRNAAFHIARAAPVNEIALFGRPDRRMLPVSDAGHDIQMSTVFQRLLAFAEASDEVRAVMAQILHLAGNPLAIKNLLEAERAAHFVSRRVDGILRHQGFKNFQRQSVVDHFIRLISGSG